MSETTKPNPYDVIYRGKETAILAGARTPLEPANGPLSHRLQEYAYFRMETATEGADAMLVNDLLDAAIALRRVGK